MRIAWVVPGFRGPDEEEERGIPALTALAGALGREHELLVFAVRFPPRAAHYRVGDKEDPSSHSAAAHCGVAVRSFGAPEDPTRPALRRRAASLLRWGRVLQAVALEHRRAPFAVIHGWWATESGLLAALAARALGVPCLVSLAGGELASVRPIDYGSGLHMAERARVAVALHLATAIGAGSADARSRLLVRYPWLAGRVLALPLGFDPAVFAPRPALGAAPGRVVCAASWTPVKGHDLLLDAAALLAERGRPLELLLAGERTDGPEARAAVASRGLASRVRLLGPLAQPALAEALAGAQLAVLASWHEAQCLAVVEALACGTPVLSTPVGIARELLGHPSLGRCLTRRSPALLASALAGALERTAAPEERAGCAAAVAHLALPQTAARFLAAYGRLAGRHRAAPSGA